MPLIDKAGRDLGFVTLDTDCVRSSGEVHISVDYAVMENTARAAVVPVAMGWSDVGSWHAVWELSDKDGQGNAAQGARGVRGFPQLQRFDRQGAGRAGGCRRSGGRGHPGCGAGIAARRMPTD